MEFADQGNGTVIDRGSGLMWERSGSDEPLTYAQALDYIARLNADKFAGHSDWRLPAPHEAMRLLHPHKNEAVQPFSQAQRWIWTNRKIASAAWVVFFSTGRFLRLESSYYCVRAVRQG